MNPIFSALLKSALVQRQFATSPSSDHMMLILGFGDPSAVILS